MTKKNGFLLFCSLFVLALPAAALAGEFNAGVPNPRSVGQNQIHYYHSRGYDAHAKSVSKPSPKTYDPTGGAVSHNIAQRMAHDAALAEQHKVQRNLATQGRAAQSLFANHDKPVVVTRGSVEMNNGKHISVTAKVDRQMNLEISIPTGSWYDFNLAAYNLHGKKTVNRKPVTVSGKINPQSGMFHLRQDGTNIVGHINPRGEVVLKQLDASYGGNRVAKLKPNKTATAVGGIRGSYRSTTSYGAYSLGKPQPSEQ